MPDPLLSTFQARSALGMLTAEREAQRFRFAQVYAAGWAGDHSKATSKLVSLAHLRGCSVIWVAGWYKEQVGDEQRKRKSCA